jgi:hypothetical protein
VSGRFYGLFEGGFVQCEPTAGEGRSREPVGGGSIGVVSVIMFSDVEYASGEFSRKLEDVGSSRATKNSNAGARYVVMGGTRVYIIQEPHRVIQMEEAI